MNLRPCLLLPVRSFAGGKRRLAGYLDDARRRQLNERFLDHLLREAALWPGLQRTVVVSPCREVLERARAAGAGVLRQAALPGLDEAASETLNAALTQARCALLDAGAQALMVLPSDLPLVRTADLRRLAHCGEGVSRGRVVVAVDRAGSGTNGLYLPAGADMPFRFGPDSARLHCLAARAGGWPVARVAMPGLALDIDTPADYEAWQPLAACA